MVRWMRWHCPPDTGFEIRALVVWGRAPYLSVTGVSHNIESIRVSGEEFFFSLEFEGPIFQAGSFNHCTRAPALHQKGPLLGDTTPSLSEFLWLKKSSVRTFPTSLSFANIVCGCWSKISKSYSEKACLRRAIMRGRCRSWRRCVNSVVTSRHTAVANSGHRYKYLTQRHWPNTGLMLGQRRRRWPNLKPALGQCLVFYSGFHLRGESLGAWSSSREAVCVCYR